MSKLSNAVRHKLEEATEVREPAAFIGDLKTLGSAHATVRLDQATGADALSRIIAECFREPDAFLGYFAGFITMGQILSLPLADIKALRAGMPRSSSGNSMFLRSVRHG